ncbi:MAG TPA: hotdog fold thioesterase [Chloroflexi bacterium]|nr:hotdog fold thioesterase [Chloroflexota bacterium]
MIKIPASLEALQSIAQNTMSAHLGIEFTGVGADFVSAKMPVDQRTKQPFGILHGGASVALAETLGSVASSLCIDLNKAYPVGLEINANHIRSVSEGYVYGSARPLHLGRRTHVWDIQIVNEDKKLVCVSRLTVMIVAKG